MGVWVHYTEVYMGKGNLTVARLKKGKGRL